MAIQWKRNTRYPSVTRPGVFPRIQDIDEVTGEDILEDTWFELTGIDEQEVNKFKFALGTWVHISRRNRKIRLLNAKQVNAITYPITDDSEDAGTTEPKPDYKPEGFLQDKTPFQWALDKALLYGYSSVNERTTEDDYDPNKNHYNSDDEWVIGGVGEGQHKMFIATPDGKGDYKAKVNKGTYAYLQAHDWDRWNINGSPQNWETRNTRGPAAGPGPHHVGKGDITKDGIWICYRHRTENYLLFTQYHYYFKANIKHPKWKEDTKRHQPSPGFQWFWSPSNDEITDPQTGLKAFGEWVEGGSLIETQNQAGSENQYVGLVTNKPITDVDDIEQENLFLYHDVDSENYKNISVPLEVYFSLHFLERDNDSPRSSDIIKYQVIEWGDEKRKMSDQQILDSEFFYLYETDDSVFDGTKYKKLCLIADDAIQMQNVELNTASSNLSRDPMISHIYTEPGVKTIKTIVFRFEEGSDFLLETSIVHTNIFIADPNQTIQNFNIFGAEDYSVIPLEKELEPIIGNVDKRSEYVRSIEKIKNNDLYQSSDYLEKLYADDFLPKVKNDLYGEYAGNIDLGIMRVFKKPYNIFDFIGGDALEIIDNNFEYPQDSLPLNSSATEILISDEDCVINLDPSNQTSDQIENNGISDEKGVLMGDFRLVKNPNQKIRKEDSMQLPKVNTQKKRQAF